MKEVSKQGGAISACSGVYPYESPAEPAGDCVRPTDICAGAWNDLIVMTDLIIAWSNTVTIENRFGEHPGFVNHVIFY
jgi:hypothetical protein